MLFDRYIGVDWSGAKGPKLKGLQVALCDASTAPPILVHNPAGGHWTRNAFVNWMTGQLDGDGRTLCGLDYSFCFPWCDLEAYFPDDVDNPSDWSEFWQLVETVCSQDDGFFGGQMAADSRFAPYFAVIGSVGQNYQRRLRVTEQACQAQGLGTPESVFNLRGARQVGKGSLAGMRVLQALRRTSGVAIWPFDAIFPHGSAIVETFPTAFVRMAGRGPGKIRTLQDLGKVLRHYNSDAPAQTPDITDDQADALVSAAALRCLASDSDLWHPAGLSDRVRRYEGWTFGVR